MRALLAVLDGAADRPQTALQQRTPLEAANKPTLDSLVQNSFYGTLRIAKNIAPESDVGVLALLGQDPFKTHTRRSALEALGAGEKFEPGMLALRANFATLDEKGNAIVDRRVDRSLSSTEAKILAEELNSKMRARGINAKLVPTAGHRAVLLAKAQPGAFSRDVSNTDPGYAITETGLATAQQSKEARVQHSKALTPTKNARETARFVNLYSKAAHGVLQQSAVNKSRAKRGLSVANGLLLRDAETRLKPPARKLRDWMMIADMPLEIGIGIFLGMRVLKLPPFFTTHDYNKRAQLAATALRKSNVYVHIKGPDVFGHDGDAKGKTRSIEDIDKHFFKPLLQKIDLEKVRIAVTSDHSTPCTLKAHSSDPVPFLIVGAGVQKTNGIANFSEKTCTEGPQLEAKNLMRELLAKRI